MKERAPGGQRRKGRYPGQRIRSTVLYLYAAADPYYLPLPSWPLVVTTGGELQDRPARERVQGLAPRSDSQSLHGLASSLSSKCVEIKVSLSASQVLRSRPSHYRKGYMCAEVAVDNFIWRPRVCLFVFWNSHCSRHKLPINDRSVARAYQTGPMMLSYSPSISSISIVHPVLSSTQATRRPVLPFTARDTSPSLPDINSRQALMGMLLKVI